MAAGVADGARTQRRPHVGEAGAPHDLVHQGAGDVVEITHHDHRPIARERAHELRDLGRAQLLQMRPGEIGLCMRAHEPVGRPVDGDVGPDPAALELHAGRHDTDV